MYVDATVSNDITILKNKQKQEITYIVVSELEIRI